VCPFVWRTEPGQLDPHPVVGRDATDEAQQAPTTSRWPERLHTERPRRHRATRVVRHAGARGWLTEMMRAGRCRAGRSPSRLTSSAAMLVVLALVPPTRGPAPRPRPASHRAPAAHVAFKAVGDPAGPRAPTPPGPPGYWMVATDGGVFSFGSAGFRGSAGAVRLAQPIVGLAPTPTGRGYWLAAGDGGVFTYGDAVFLGSAAGRPGGAAAIVAIAGTPTGKGLWLFAADASVYTLGDATYWGRPPPAAVHAPIVSAAASPSGQGYYLAAADGSVYPLGDARALGDASRLHLSRPIVGMAATPSGRGYWLVADDGGIFAYGDAAFEGSTGAIRLNRPIVGLAPTASGHGYWLFASDGGVFAFGDATFLGSTGGIHLVRPVVGARTPPAVHGTGVAIFYYPWYARSDRDGAWRHWDEGGHTPPDDIGSDYYPLRGAYSSTDPAVLDAQMNEIAGAGIDEAVVSWWGQGSFEDHALGGVVAAAKAHGVSVGIHLEPYPGRTTTTVASDYAYLQGLGINDIWVYMADLMPADGLATINDAFPGVRSMAESGNVAAVKSGNFAHWASIARYAGIYLYDAINYEGVDLTSFCGYAHPYRLVCAPVAAPGFVGVRVGASYGRSRESGSTYDRRWLGDLGSRPDVVAITSYNEWHEGTQIEPAVARCLGATFCYRNYEGAYGVSAQAAPFAYIDRTRYWTGLLRSTAP